MTTHLIFIRHGQSTWNALKKWQGHANPPLSETGIQQAHLLGQRMSTWKIGHLYASDLLRARETADILGKSLGLRPTVDPIWRERDLGEAEGLTTEEIATRFPEVWAARTLGPMAGIPGSEAHESVIRRAALGCRELLTRHPEETIAIVTHGGMILATLVHLLDLPPSGHSLLSVGGNTSISRVSIESGHARLIGLNDSAHLELNQSGPGLAGTVVQDKPS